MKVFEKNEMLQFSNYEMQFLYNMQLNTYRHNQSVKKKGFRQAPDMYIEYKFKDEIMKKIASFGLANKYGNDILHIVYPVVQGLSAHPGGYTMKLSLKSVHDISNLQPTKEYEAGMQKAANTNDDQFTTPTANSTADASSEGAETTTQSADK